MGLNMERWRGRVAVVTGASSGIGEAVALSLAECGLVVVGISRRMEKIEDLAKRSKGTVHAVRCDLTDEADIKSAFAEIHSKYGGVDVLVNSAGFLKLGRLKDGQLADWRTTMDVNVMALCVCTREAIGVMEKTGSSGHIVHINSVAGHTVPQYQGHHFGVYYASKHAVTALTESLRVELQEARSGIKVTSISPGSVNTNMVRKVAADIQGKSFDESQPLGERPETFLDAKDVADAVVYVLGTPPHVQVHELIMHGMGHKYC